MEPKWVRIGDIDSRRLEDLDNITCRKYARIGDTKEALEYIRDKFELPNVSNVKLRQILRTLHSMTNRSVGTEVEFDYDDGISWGDPEEGCLAIIGIGERGDFVQDIPIHALELFITPQLNHELDTAFVFTKEEKEAYRVGASNGWEVIRNGRITDILEAHMVEAKANEIIDEKVKEYIAAKAGKEKGNMKKIKDVLVAQQEQSKDAAIVAAKIEAGKTGITAIANQIKPFVKPELHVFLETEEVQYGIAQVAALVLNLFAEKNDKAPLMAECMLTAASTAEISKLKLPEIINGLAGSMGLDALNNKLAETLGNIPTPEVSEVGEEK